MFIKSAKSVDKDEKVVSKKKEISYDDLLEFMKGDSKFLFDVREATEVSQTSLLPSATNLPCKISFSINERVIILTSLSYFLDSYELFR